MMGFSILLLAARSAVFMPRSRRLWLAVCGMKRTVHVLAEGVLGLIWVTLGLFLMRGSLCRTQ